MLFIDLAYYASYLGVVGVKRDVLVFKWDGAYINKVYMDRAYLNRVYIDRVLRSKVSSTYKYR